MTTEQMIEVMQHYVDGGEVEVAINGEWECANPPIWGWDAFDYRIKPEPKKTKTVWFWKIRLKDGWWMPSDMHTEEEVKNNWEQAIEYKRMDILGSEEVEV